MSTSSSAPPPVERIATRRLWWLGLLVVVLSTVVNGLVRALALAALEVHPDFRPLQSFSFIPLTVVGTGAGVGVFWLLGRLSRRPISTFRVVAVIALIFSYAPDILMVVGGMPGATWGAALVLMLQHTLAAAITVGLLTTLGRERA
jgi:hypothetical protein